MSKRLCLVLAVAAVSTGPEASVQLLQQILSSLSATNSEQMIMMYFQLLGCIAEETDNAERVRRDALLGALAPFIPGVIAAATASLAPVCGSNSITSTAVETARTALFALLKWFQMSNANMGSPCALSAGQLALRHQSAFQVLIQALGMQDVEGLRVLVDVWNALLSSELSFGQVDENVEQAALRALAEGLIAQGTRMCSALDSDATRLLTQVAVALVCLFYT